MALSSHVAWKEVATRVFVHVYPSHLKDMRRAVYDRLNRYLLKYNEALGGVPVSYSDVEIEEDKLRIRYDYPHLHLHVQVKFLVFAPAFNSLLTGTVKKVGADHVGLLVYGLFNASIPSDQLPSSFAIDESSPDSWVDAATGLRIEAGSDILFQVTSVDNTNDMLTLTGSMTNDEAKVLSSPMPSTPSKTPSKAKKPLKSTKPTEPPVVSSTGKRRLSVSSPPSSSSSSSAPVAAPVPEVNATPKSASKKKKAEPESATPVPTPVPKKKTEPESTSTPVPKKKAAPESTTSTPAKKRRKDDI